MRRTARDFLIGVDVPLSNRHSGRVTCEDQRVTSLSELQAKIGATRDARGFTTDPVHLVVLLAEEVGEIAREVKGLWSPNYDGFDAQRLAPELADALVLLSALASAAEVDLEAAIDQKFFSDDAKREWKSAR